MSQAHHTEVVLDLETNGSVIRGSISSVQHNGEHFYGWLELANALETVRIAARVREAGASPLHLVRD